MRSRVCHDDPAKRDLAGFFHGCADDAERLLGHLAVRGEEIRVVPVKAVDVFLRDEALDVDGLGAFEFDPI